LRNLSLALKNIGVNPPILICVSYFGMESHVLGSGPEHASGRQRIVPGSFRVPEKLVNEWGELDDIVSFTKPLIDVVWNAAGLPASPNFRTNGTYLNTNWNET
jgi:hypothetical protein